MNYLSLLNNNNLVTISKYCLHIYIPINFVSGIVSDLILFMNTKYRPMFMFIECLDEARHLKKYYTILEAYIVVYSYCRHCLRQDGSKFRMKSRVNENYRMRKMMICENCIAEGASEYLFR